MIDTIRLFLRGQWWRLGALFGRTEQEAFFITCDRTTMTQDDILNGRLICEIGIAPVRPAEFVIFRIFQHPLRPSARSRSTRHGTHRSVTELPISLEIDSITQAGFSEVMIAETTIDAVDHREGDRARKSSLSSRTKPARRRALRDHRRLAGEGRPERPERQR